MRRILGQQLPAAGTDALLYQVPLTRETEVKSVIVCNKAAVADSFSIWIVPRGETKADKHLIYPTVPINSFFPYSAEHSIQLSAGDSIWVNATNGTCVFSAYGVEDAA